MIKIKMTNKLSDTEIKEIVGFLKNCKNVNFFQSTQAFSFYSSQKNFNPIYIIAYDDEEIVGSLLCIRIKEMGSIKGYLSRRIIIEGGPLIRKNYERIVLSPMLKKLNSYADTHAIYTEFRNSYDVSKNLRIFESHDFEYEEHFNILVNLQKSEEQLWSEVNSKKRNKIRKAYKEGTRFKVANTEQELKAAYKILLDVYQRVKLPLPNYSYFYSLYNDLSDSAEFIIFIAIYKNEIIGCRLNIGYNCILYDLYSGAYPKYYDKNPNDLLPWEIFKWGKQNGYGLFDFGGAGKPNIPYGVRDYKKSFGGTFVNYGRLKRINNKFQYQLGKLGIKIMRNF
jgi:lipid II:glycine glycyltransferase (peptidoglycan interpeptide bridge formation enzyme)